MNKKLLDVIAIALLIIIFGCSESPYTCVIENGITVHVNSGEGQDSKISIEPKLLFSIDGSFEAKSVEDYDRKFTEVSDLEIDGKGNIYIFNPKLERILKYDSNGHFIKYFGSRGTGRGEFTNAMDFAIINDTLYVKNTFTKLMIRYTLEGEYIDDFFYTDGELLIGESMKAVSKETAAGYLSGGEKKEEDVFLFNKLVLFNKKFEEAALLRECRFKFNKNNPKFFDMITKYAVGNSNIYVAENEDDKYRISIFDLDGKKTGEIRKTYSKIEYNQDEKEKMKRLPLSMNKEPLENTVQYKKSVNNIYIDKYGRLLVCPSVERDQINRDDFIIDVFDNGKFIKRITVPFLKGEDFLHRFDSNVYFIGDRIYEVIKGVMRVNVYDY